MIPLITIEGPTASGKSALAIALAERLCTEIISADSRQIYKYLSIGTAKPKPEELLLVKHHLVDFLDPSESFNAGAFASEATAIIERLYKKQMIPIICGGTGLYVKALLDGLCELPPIPHMIRKELEQELDKKGLAALYSALEKIDPELHLKISSNDRQRILRALEVYRFTGKSLSSHWSEQRPKNIFKTFRILCHLPRSLLYEKINLRLELMLQEGLIDEISDVMTLGFDNACPGLNSLGYKEFLPYLNGSMTLERCLHLAQQHSRNYAKRQITWYRKQDFDLTLDMLSFNISDINRLLSKIGSCLEATNLEELNATNSKSL